MKKKIELLQDYKDTCIHGAADSSLTDCQRAYYSKAAETFNQLIDRTKQIAKEEAEVIKRKRELDDDIDFLKRRIGIKED